MSEDIKSLVVRVSCMCLQRMRIFSHDLPVFSIEQRSLHKDAILRCWEVYPTHYLADEVDFGLEVCTLAVLVRIAEAAVADCAEGFPDHSVLFKLRLLHFSIKF